MIEIDSLTVGYGNRVVLGPFSASLAGGRLTILVGGNGKGKSTLLRTIAGAQRPLGGNVRINGKDIHSGISAKERARMLSLVYTERYAAGDLTVEETVALGRQPYTGIFGRLGDDDREAIGSALRSVGIEELRNRQLATLSDGERQKTMIARAIVQAGGVMILDEPTAFLDAAGRIDIMQLLKRMCREKGLAIVLSTHDIAPAMAVADDLWVIDRTTRQIVSGTRDGIIESGVMDRVFESKAVRFDRTALDYRPSNPT